MKKYYYEKFDFDLFDFDDSVEKYDTLEVCVDEKKYSIWGIKDNNADLLDENFMIYFDKSVLDYASKVEEEKEEKKVECCGEIAGYCAYCNDTACIYNKN